MYHNRFGSKVRKQPPPIVPKSARAWFAPMAKLALASLFLLGISVVYAIGRQAQFLADAAARNH